MAYVRFASVYRQFRDVGQFKREVDELQKVEQKVKSEVIAAVKRSLVTIVLCRGEPSRSCPRRPCR